jgi:hypothetical protein
MIYEDETISILGVKFESFEDYIKHFLSINRGKTSYVVKVGGIQY